MAFVKGLLSDNSGRFILRRYGKLRVIALVSCALAFVFVSGIFAPFSYRSNTTEATSQSTQPSTLTLTSVRNTATVSINPTPTGVFGKSADSASISFNVITNNFSGYTLSTRTSRTTMTNGSSSLSSLASTVSESQFSNASNTTLNNRWGYKPNYYNSSTNSNFLPSPGTSSSTLDHTTAANSTAKNYTIALGARVNTEVPAGTYVNDTLVLEATANAVPYTIKFNKAADDDIVSNMPANQTGESVSANNVTLSTTTPTRVNYTFAGWCTTIPVASAGGYTCNGTTYAPGSDYNINFTVDNTNNNLYAIWTSTRGCNKAATTIGTGVTATDAVCMQDINDTIISSMTTGVQHTLIDMRDGKSYFIAKQADGKVWMTQNLDYDLSTSTTLTHNNTDLGYTTSNLNKTWTPARATITGAVSSWHNDASVVDSFDPGTKYYYSSGTLDDDAESTTCNDASTCAHYHVGNYYNWPAAVAGNLPVSSDMYTKAEDSVCPAGWRLPKGAVNDYTYEEFASLFSATDAFKIYYYDSTAKITYTNTLNGLNYLRDSPIYFIRPGYIKEGELTRNKQYITGWTSVIESGERSFDFWIMQTQLYIRDATPRDYGEPVRCIARMSTGTTTVNFNGNGASGSMSPRTAESGNAINITNTFERDGYKFVKWNTSADGNGTDYTGVPSGSLNAIIVPPTQNSSITLYAQWEEAYVIKYDGNNATGTTTMSVTHEVANNTEITLYASNYSRAGYGFLGWSTTQIDPDASDAATQIANAKIFGPNETITANTANLGRPYPASITLYAVWIKSAGDMQDWQGCSSMSIGDVTARKDTRDNNVYAIAKLVDGSCWMIENLRLDNEHSTDPTKAQGFGGNFVGLAGSEYSSLLYESILPNSLYTTDSSDTTRKLVSSTVEQEQVFYSIPRYYNSVGGTTPNVTSANLSFYSYGNYYNLPAAKASTTAVDGGSSICPSGWFLPETYEFSTYAGGGYGVLNNNANNGSKTTSANLRKYPINLIYSGYIWNGSMTGRGSNGVYWSDTSSGYSASWDAMRIADDVSNPSYTPYRTVVATIRCITPQKGTAVAYANDGSNRKQTFEKRSGSAIFLGSDSFFRDGYAITSWNTSADGSGTSYPAETSFNGDAQMSGVTVLYAQWSPAYKIVYNGNNAVNADGMSTLNHPYVASGTEVTLFANNFNRPGYGFLGWSITQINPDASNASTLIANTKIFGPTETIIASSTTLGASAPANITLYAVWLKSSGNIDSWNGCSSMTAATYSSGTITPGSVVALTDVRDNNTYAIAKLSDGNCWMIEDLRLDPATANITASNTNRPTANFLSERTTNHTYCSTAGAACFDVVRYSNVTNTYYSGFYYNWYTATAGNGTYSKTTETATGDICPAGWQMTDDYSVLARALGYTTRDGNYTHTNPEISDRLRTYPNNFIYSGYITSGYVGLRTGGDYWTSRSINNVNARHLAFADDGWYSLNPSTIKVSAIKVRCQKKIIWVTYDGNGADSGTSTSVEHIVKTNNTLTLMPSNFKRSGYGFAGWSTTQIDPDAANAATQIANATIYGPIETISTSDFTGDSAKLYAVWVKSTNNLQNWNGCSSLSQGSVTALKDTRDNQVYAIAKLADGNCWMIENLRLDSANSTDSNKSQGFGGVFYGLASSELASFTASTLANSLYTFDTTSTSLNIITGKNKEYRIPRYNYLSTNQTVTDMTIKDSNIYSYGNYYNWPAAIANTNFQKVDDGEERGTSICPAGWRLPTGGNSTDDYGNLITTINGGSSTDGTKLREYPNNFLFAGVLTNSSLNYRGTTGYYWSSSVSGTTGSSYRLEVSTSAARQTAALGSAGSSVRCIKATGIEIILDANDGTDRVARIYGTAGTSITLSDETFIYNGYKIASWNTSDDGSGTSYTTNYTIPSSSTRLYAQWENAYTIHYDGNNATSGTNMNSTAHLNVANGDEIMLYANNFGRTGYGFLGWSITQINPDASNASTLIANAKIFGPNETITISPTTMGQAVSDGGTDITLYAVWLKSSGDLQTWQGCGDLTAATYSSSTGVITPGSVIALTDTRDNNTYAIAKLADGKCWMIENLRLNPATAEMTAENTNGPTRTFLSQRTQTFQTCTSNTADCVERVLFKENTTESSYSGTYYNWYTATAGNGKLDSFNTFGDICPIGWHLPTGGTSTTSEFASLNVSVGGTRANLNTTSTPTGATISGRLRTYPYNLLYNGYATGSQSLNGYKENGSLWPSNTWTSNSNNVYLTSISNTEAGLSYGRNKYYHQQMRCVKDSTKVKYDGNGASTETTMKVTHPATPGSTITLYASNYRRDGYGFLGWSYTQIDPDASNFATQLANATVYGPNETITLPSVLNDTTILYAVWIKSAGDMQNWSGCSSMSIGDVTARKDTRDNNVYAIAKLADGKCWMIENLRLSNDYDNIDWGDKTKSQGFGGVFNGLANSELATIASLATPNSVYTADSTVTSDYKILGDNPQYRIPRYNDTNTTNTIEDMSSGYENVYSYGNYYNFAAAKASTSEMATVANSENSGTSICPAGWRLPTNTESGNNKEYEVMNTNVNSGSTASSTGLRTYPNNFIYSGYIWASTLNVRGSEGAWWSTTAESGVAANYFDMTTSAVTISTSSYRSAAYAVRCIAASGVTITLDSNNGSNKIGHIYGAASSTVTLPSDNFYYADHVLSSWNTAANGSGTSYAPGATYTISSAQTLYAQWEAAYTIVYNGNNATSTSNMNAFVHAGVKSGDSVLLYASNVAKTGYGFLGWSLTQLDPDVNDYDTLLANTKIYGPNETMAASSTLFGTNAPATVTLYAVWVKSTGNLQSWDGCGQLTKTTYSNGTITPGSVTALTDTRDGNTYAVAKLSDGKCWIIEALRLDPKTADITASNTNNPTTTFLSERTTSYAWCSSDTAACVERVLYRNPRLVEQSGIYYNYYTATAGNGTRDLASGTHAAGDICPSGWHLPTGTTSGEYANLGYNLGGKKANATTSTSPTAAVLSERFRTYPNNFLYHGYTYNSSNDYSFRTYAYYSASTSYISGSTASQYFFGFSEVGGYVRYSYIARKYNAYLVRCIKGGGKISYNGNGASNSTAMDEAFHSDLTAGASVTLQPSNYQRSGYGFLGWSQTQIDPDASNFATILAGATVYGPNETIDTTGFSDNVTLYAVWIKSAGNLQGWTGCSSLAQGGVTALKDTRDNQVYAVAKLVDGKCWMIENLRLDAANSTDSTKAQGFGGVFEGLANSETTNFSDSIIDNSLYTTNTLSSSSAKILGDHPSHRIPRYNNQNTANTVSSMTKKDSNVYSYGNYYNYAAAIANTSDIRSVSASNVAGSSICPAGWRLPSGGSGNSSDYDIYLTSLANTYAARGVEIRKYPNNFLFAGSYSGSSVSSRGYYGFYLSSSVYLVNSQADYASSIAFYSSSAFSSYDSKYTAKSVRCVTDDKVTITLDANDGSNRVARIYGTSGSTISLPFDQSFYNENYKISSWNTNAAGTGTSYTSTYTISSNVTLYAQWDTSAYTITYNGNGTESAYNMNQYAHPNVTTGESIMLYTANFHRTGYGFLGWSTTQINPDASNAATLIANAKIFGPNETIVANSTNLGQAAPASITLYAVWLKQSGIIQDFATSDCEAMTAATYSNGVMTPGSVVALKDYRDNETYAVAKLADGRCWMVENLRLDPSTANITAALTNNPDSTFLANRTNSYDWCRTLDADCSERILAANSTAIDGGLYYNWYTATAGNGTYDFVGTAMGDICPAGWHIPTGHNGEFKTWIQSAGANSGGLASIQKLAVYPYNFIYNGTKEDDFIYEYREKGGYWSSVSSDYDDATHWVEAAYSFESNPIYNNNYLAKPAGAPVRCIKDDVVVTYNGNGASNSTSMSVRLNVERGATVTLSASNYQRTGYGFLGWSTTQIDPDASNFATLLSNATIYGPNETITIPANASNNIVLYATWIKSAGNLQNWSGCSSMSTGGVTALKDTRDNQVYAVAKLADGNCWMIENLRLSHNSSNPDWGDPSLSQGFGGVFHGLAESEASSFAESTIANTLYTTDLSSATQYAITGENIQYRFPRYNNQNTANTVSSMTTTNQNIYSYGNYYNYSAATASTIDSSESYSSSFPGTSICPAGWILPQYSKSTFGNLQTAIADASLTNSQAFRKYPNNFIMAGSFTSGSSSNRGSTGYYTGQRNIYNGSTYQMTITTTQTATAGSGGVSVGKSVRCLTSSGLEIKLYANDGSGRVVRIYNTAGTTNALQPETFSRNNYKITSWNTAANGSGTQYTDSYTIPSGATSGITLYAQWSPTYTLVYNGNGATGTTTMSIQNIGGAEGDTVILYASNYQRSGYGFAGWSITQIDPDAANAASQIANATIFGPNESITLNSTTLGQALNGSPKTITLYAVWVKSAGNMQGWTGCSSMATNEITARRDARDGNVYAIAKLIDGNCWMIENLRLSNNATNSNWGDPTLSQGFGGVFNGLANSETTTVTASSTANSLYTQGTTSGLITISGDSLVYGDSIDYRFPRYNNINTASTEASMITSASNVYSYGNYYNPAGSIANTNLYRDATGADGSDNAGTSLCPAGWRLPKGGTNAGDIYDLDQLLKTGTNAWDYVVLRQFPQNFVMSGKYHAGRASQRGEAGYYATSSLNTNGAFNMVSIVYSGYSSVSGGSATSIRCMYGSGVEVVLNANDGSGRVARLYGTAGSTITLPDKLFARSDGYGSNRWNTTSAGTGTEYTSSYTLPTGATSANLYATWKQSYSIAYNGNGDTGGTSMAVKNKNVVEGDTVILNPSNFSRSGYGFLGWSFTQIDPDASNAATLIANATIYGPMESITAPARTDSIMTLYAVWVKSAGDMQSWAGCSSMSAGAVTARKDTRDDQVYAIAKLADGHCWMIENLRLGVSGSSSSALSQGFGGVFNGLANSESSFLTTTASNSLYGIDGSGSSFIITASTHTFIDSNNRSYDLSGYSIPRFNSTNTTSTTTSMGSISANVYSFGNYYNWPAAMANTTMLTTISAAESAGTSICPKGWHLPTHGTNAKEYYTLYTSTKIDSNDTTGVGMRKYPNNFILSGYKSGSNTNDRGKEGEYWSRSLTANATSYYQSYQAGVFRIGTTNIINNSFTTIKGYGASVRCLADY